jgi:hypothetical protein
MNFIVDISTKPADGVDEDLGKYNEAEIPRVVERPRIFILSPRWSKSSLLCDGSAGDDFLTSRRRSSISLDAQRLFLLEAKQVAECEFRRSSFTANIQSLMVDGRADNLQLSFSAFSDDSTMFEKKVETWNDNPEKKKNYKTVSFSHVQIREHPYVKMTFNTT